MTVTPIRTPFVLTKRSLSRRRLLQGGALAAAGAVVAQPARRAHAQLEITVQGGEFQPIPVVLPIFRGADAAGLERAKEIHSVVANDLESSGLFQVIAAPAPESIDVAPDFSRWRGQDAIGLVAAEVGEESDRRLGVRFRLWDVAQGEQIEQLKFLTDPSGWRRAAHKVADVVYSRLTGEGPYFDSRVVFVDERGPKTNRQKRLAIMDSDGANVVSLDTGSELVLTPRFSPVDQEITYTSWDNGEPQITLLNLRTQGKEELGRFPGMTFAPRFSPDGQRIIMSLSQSGATNIFTINLATRERERLTNSPGIDTAPSFSPDGQRVVFESDRGGSQQLYVMRKNGADPRRISFGEGRYATPVWSPRGDLIAFTKMLQGRFHIGVMTPEGENEQLLSGSFLDEGPTWSPNGRVLMFFRETPGAAGGSKLMTVDVTGRNLREMRTPNGASDPAWSPLIDI